MKQEKWITVVICLLILLGAGGFYLRSGGATSESNVSFHAPDATTASTNQSATSKDQTVQSVEATEEYAVYICGAVKHPGVYRFTKSARVCDVIEAAGGLKKNAAATSINQARYLTDGEQIEILTQKQWKKRQEQTEETDSSTLEQTISSDASGLIDLNSATETELMTLSGIGESKAKAIIDYRSQNGSFEKIEDVMKVNGIKEGVYQQIKDFITV